MISVCGLSLKLGEFCLRDISLEVAAQEYFVILGPTGTGKTLLIESIAGLLRPQHGEIWIADRNVTNLRPEDRRVGYLPQDYALFPHLTVRQNILFGMRIRKIAQKTANTRVDELASMLGITHLLNRNVLHLSGGERQRTALARALAIEPKVLLLDEPLSALDEQTRENLCAELRQVHERCGTTTVHISHSFEETLALADRIAVVNAGRIEQVGPPTEVMSQPATEFVAGFVRSQNIFYGSAQSDKPLTAITVDSHTVYSAIDANGAVTAVIRPENITLNAEQSSSSCNHFPATVVQIMERGALTRVDVITSSRMKFVTLCTRQHAEGLHLYQGKPVFLSFSPQDVHLIPNA